jgi:carboxyvinyl-carboxyphosphonate phosphorylmutase
MNGKNGKAVAERLQEDHILVAPGAHDALTARIIEAVGFEAVYMTGYGASATLLGRPDVGLLTFSEMVDHARNIVDAVNVPVLADADTGYGNAVNVIRTTKAYERAGVAVMQLEDQVAPKKCGHMLGRDVIPKDEMVGKIHAACDARQSRDNMLVMARTDARTSYGIDEAIARGHAYEEAGADILFIESVESEDEMRRVTSEFSVPVLANMLEGGRTPFLSAPELEKIGYDLVIYCVSSTYATAQAMFKLMTELKETGTTKRLLDTGDLIPFEKFNELIGLPQVREFESKYATGRDLKGAK